MNNRIHHIEENIRIINESVAAYLVIIGLIAAFIWVKKMFQSGRVKFVKQMESYSDVIVDSLHGLNKLGFNRAEFISISDLRASISSFKGFFTGGENEQDIIDGFIKLSNTVNISMIDLIIGSGFSGKVDLSHVMTIDDILSIKVKDIKTKKALLILNNSISQYISTLKQYSQGGSVDINMRKVLDSLDKGVRVMIDIRTKKISQRQGLTNKHSNSGSIILKTVNA